MQTNVISAFKDNFWVCSLKYVKFNFDAFSRNAMEKLKRGEPLTGTKGVFTPLLKMFLEASLEGEALEHIEETKAEKNRRNGKSCKTMKSDLGKFQLETHRDRNGSFEPQTVPKRQVVIANDIDKKIIGLYGLGMSYSDIQNHLREMYDFEVSDGTLNSITDSILPEIRDWQSRPLECVYPVIWLDAMYSSSQRRWKGSEQGYLLRIGRKHGWTERDIRYLFWR